MTEAPRLTKNQSVVFDVLSSSDTPLSAYQILDVDLVRGQGLKAPLTIYRALEKLVALGKVHRLESLNAFVACDHEPHTDATAFMICSDCKRTIEFATGPLQRMIAKQATAQRFEVGDVHVEICGRCEECSG